MSQNFNVSASFHDHSVSLREVTRKDDHFQSVSFFQKCATLAIFFYLRYLISYRNLQEIIAELGVDVDHTKLS